VGFIILVLMEAGLCTAIRLFFYPGEFIRAPPMRSYKLFHPRPAVPVPPFQPPRFSLLPFTKVSHLVFTPPFYKGRLGGIYHIVVGGSGAMHRD
jgi:hypothetical protein